MFIADVTMVTVHVSVGTNKHFSFLSGIAKSVWVGLSM